MFRSLLSSRADADSLDSPSTAFRRLLSADNRKRLTLLALVPALSIGIVACGDTTVDSADVKASASATASASKESKNKDSAASSTSTSAVEAPAVKDPAPSRVSEAPRGQMPLSDKDEQYLDALIAEKIDVKGVEDQLIAAGQAHCQPAAKLDSENIMVNAIAGQLIAQERTTGTAPEVAGAIAKAAEKAYC